MPETKTYAHKGRIIRAELRTTATPQQVWKAWTDPEKIAQCFVDRATGSPEVGATFTWIFERFNYEFPYEVLAAVPNERLALLGSAPGREPSIIEVRIERAGGQTVVRLVHSGFREGAEWEDEYAGVVSGWQMAPSVLRHYLENYFSELRSTFLLLRPAQFTYARLLPCEEQQ